MSGQSCQGILNQVKDLVADLRSEIFSLANHDDVMEDFLTQLSNLNSRNILTAQELEEYEAMEAAGKVLTGKELDDAYTELISDDFGDLDEDNKCLIEEIELADSHIELLSQLQKATNNEIQHLSSGMHQLQQQEKAAHYNLLAEARHCIKLDSKVHSAQEDLIKKLQLVLADYQEMENPSMLEQLHFEQYKEICCQFECNVKTLMKQLLDWNKPAARSTIDLLDDLEQSYVEMKLVYLYASAKEQGRKEVTKLLNAKITDSHTSKHILSLDEIRDQILLLEDNARRSREEFKFLWDSEIVPIVKKQIEMEVMNVKKCKNEYLHCKQKSLYKQLEDLSRSLDAGLKYSNLFLLMLVIERQKLIDTADMWKLCQEEIREDYTQFLLRMKAMKEIKEKYKSLSVMESPLVQCIRRLLDDDMRGSTDFSDLVFRVKNLKQQIDEEEQKILIECNRQQMSLLCEEKALRQAEIHLHSDTTNFVKTQCDKTSQILESSEDALKQIKEKFELKKIFFIEKPLLQEQRLLWIYFLMDPKKLVSVIDRLQTLHDRKMENRLTFKKPKVQLLPQRRMKK